MKVLKYCFAFVTFAFIFMLPVGLTLALLQALQGETPVSPSRDRLLQWAALCLNVFAGWMGARAAKRLVYDDELFMQALVGVVGDLKFGLAFLPGVGSFFAPGARKDRQEP